MKKRSKNRKKEDKLGVFIKLGNLILIVVKCFEGVIKLSRMIKS